MTSSRSAKLFLAITALAAGANLFAGCDGALADASASNVWSFSDYCGPLVDAACPAIAACVFPDGGIAQTTCPSPFSECLGTGSLDAGIASRVFTCEPTGHAVWNLNAVCDFPGSACSASDAEPAACPSFEAGIPGQPCGATFSKCVTGDKKYWCLPGATTEWVFNGYCGAGPTKVCSATTSACPEVDGGVAGSPCDTRLARCLKAVPFDAGDGGESGDSGDSGEKIFVCATR